MMNYNGSLGEDWQNRKCTDTIGFDAGVSCVVKREMENGSHLVWLFVS